MELKKISELPIKEITTVDAYLPIIDNAGEDIENYRISLLNLFKTGGIINVNRTYGDNNYTLQTALAIIEPTLLVNGVFITFKGMNGWELYQKELDTYVKYLNRIDDELEEGSNNPLSNDAITRMYYELLSGINNVAQITHPDLQGKNAEPNFQHVTQEEKDLIALTATIINGQSVTREDLLALINNNELVPNSSYRITNYTTTTVQADTASAGHDFDIIVTALSANELSEDAKCVRKSGDTYFANSNLKAWEIKYCIDNDTTRFAWVDAVNGKGVIYYMKDEWGNECPYDFKNIQFKRYPILSMPNGSTSLVFNSSTQKTKYALKDSDGVIVPIGAVIDENNVSYYFTFNAILQDSVTYDIYDASVIQKGIKNSEGGDFIVQNNKVNEAHTSFDYPYKYGQILKLNNIVINNIVNSLVYTSLSEGCHSNTFDNDCYYITFGNDCYSNTFSIKSDSNTFGNGCYYNTFANGFDSNTFGNNCYSNTFGDKCDSNTFGNNCHSNTFGTGCDSNTFGDNCTNNTLGASSQSNTFGNGFRFNTFGNYCYSNTFGNICNSNTFGNYCYSNTFGNYCDSNTFGNYCSINNFYTGTSGTTKKDYIRYIVLEDGCSRNNFYSTLTTSPSSYLQRIRIKGLNYNTTPGIQITLPETNTNYEWVIAGDSSGVIKQYCPEDSLANNYIYKIENTIVSTWTASTAYAGYGYQAQINVANLTENDIASVTFAGADVISGKYYPTIEQYNGYILVFSKVNTTIIIPTIEITKIEL